MMDKVTLNKILPLLVPAVLLLPLLLVIIPAAATPGQVAVPATIDVNGKTNITIGNSPSAPHVGQEIDVWNPDANLAGAFGVTCPLPSGSGGIKWELRADTDAAGLGDRADFLDGTSAKVTYNIPTGAPGSNKLILEFGDGGNVPIYFTGTTTITPFFPDPADPVNGADNDGDGFVDEPNPARYAWIDVDGGPLAPSTEPGTDSTADTGLYVFASCGREGPTSPPQARYVGTTTFTVEQPCKWCNKGAVLSQVTQNLGNCCTIPDIIVDVRNFDGTLDQSDPCETVDDSKVGSADPATCSIQAALNYITDMTNWITNGKDPTPGDGENFIGVTAQDCTDTVCEQNNSEGVCQNCENNTATDPARPPNGDGFETFVVTNPYEDVRLNIFGCSIDIFEPNNFFATNAISPVVTIKDSLGKVTVMDIHVHGDDVGYLIENNADLVIVKNSRAIGGFSNDSIGSLVNGDTIGYLVNDDNVEITGSPETSGWDIGIQLNGNDNELRTNNDIKNNGIGIQISGDMNESNGNDVGKEGAPNGIGIQVTSTGGNNTLNGDNVSHNTGDGIQIMGDDNKVEDEDTQENGEDGIDVSGNGNKIIKNKQIKMNGDDGIEVSGGNDANEVEENVSEDNTGNGINVSGNGNSLKKNEAEDNMMNGIEVSGNNNTLEENETHDNDKNGVKVTGDNNQLTKNDSSDNGEHGMLADGEVAPNPSGNKFDENDADDNTKQGIRACGQIDQGGNTGSGNGEDPQVDFACLDIDLRVQKTDSPDPVTGGSELTYTLTIFNDGTDPATGVKVVDELPNDVTFNSAVGSGGSGFICLHSSGTVTCTGGTVPAGGSVTITIKVQISDDGLCGDTLTNTAEVDPDDDIFESNENNNTTGNVTTKVDCANLTVDASGSGKTDSPDPVVGGGSQLTYTVVIKNTGTGAGNAAGIKVVDTLPAGTTFVAASFTTTNGFTCSHSSGVITCMNGSINAGSMATITYKVTVTDPQRCNDNIENDLEVDPDDTILETSEGDNADDTQTNVDCGDLDVQGDNQSPSGQDLSAAGGYTSKQEYRWKNDGDATIGTVTFTGTFSGTATRTGATVAFSCTGSGCSVADWSCSTLTTSNWSCSGSLAPGEQVNIIFSITGTASSPFPKTVIYTPALPTCANPSPCTSGTDSFANEEGSNLTSATRTDNIVA